MRSSKWPAAAILCLATSAQAAVSSLPAATTGDDERVARGYQYLNELQPGKAIGVLTAPYIEAVAAGDRARAARYLLLIATAFRLDENHAASLSCCRQAELLNPDSLLAKTMTADALTRYGKPLEGEKHLAPLADKAKTSWLVARSLAGVYANEGDVENAHKYAVIASRLNPDDTRTHITLAKLDYDKDAADEWAKAANCTPSAYLKKIFLWQSEFKRHPDKSDRTPLDEAARMLPDEPSWRTNKAWQLLKQAKDGDAYRLMTEAVACPRMYERAYTQLAAYCLFHKHPKTAAHTIAYLEKMHPYSPAVYFAEGLIASNRGDTAGQKRNYEKALEIDPKQNDAYAALATMPEFQADAKPSQELAQRWVANCPYSARAWMYRARLACHRQQWQAALDDYQRARAAVKRFEHDQAAHRDVWLPLCAGAGTCNYQLGNRQEALKYALLFNRLKPDTSGDLIRVRPAFIEHEKVDGRVKLAAEHGLLADMLYETGKLDDCVKEYKLAIDTNDNIEWHRGLLKAYVDKHDYSAAAKEDIIVANHAVTSDMPKAADRLKKQLLP